MLRILRRLSTKPKSNPISEPQQCPHPKTETYCNVSLIGADSKLGELTAFLLKQNPLITTLNLQGSSNASVEGMKADLAHIETRCKVKPHSGTDNYKNAMKTADIVVLLGLGGFSKTTSLGDRVMVEGQRICKLAEKCTKYAQRAVIIVCASPVSVMTPLVVDIFKQTPWYHPGRIIGFPGPFSVMLNSATGQMQNFDPQIVDVPLTGGPDLETLVPVFSRTIPCPVDKECSVELTARLRGISPKDIPKKCIPPDNFVTSIYPEAVALNRLISAVAYGIHGDDQAVGYAHVRTNLVKTCRFMVAQVKFGVHGVEHNYGLPKMSKLEEDLVLRSLSLLSFREKMACEYLDYYQSRRRDILPKFKQEEINKARVGKKC